MHRRYYGLLVIFLAWVGLGIGSAVSADFPITASALQERYVDEIRAHRKYGAYAKQALEEGYPGIAHLFRSLGASETVHARNFRRILDELGENVSPLSEPIELKSTQEHLKHAATVEADEIDHEYPVILERIESEKHGEAIENITYAWKAEKQHRDLILKIRKASSWWFGMLVNKIEGKPSRYYVCQFCGSTLTELPPNQCPICDHPVQHYEEVPGYIEKATPAVETPHGFKH